MSLILSLFEIIWLHNSTTKFKYASYNSKTKEFEETHNYIIFKVFKPNREENKYLTKNNLVLIEGYLMGNCEKDGTTKTEIPEIFIKSIRCGAK